MTRISTLGAILAITAIGPTAAIGQDPDPVEGEPTGRQTEVSIATQGSTVSEYVRALKEMAPGMNVVVTDVAGKVNLPTIQLDKIPAESALYCLMQITEGEIIIDDDEYGADIMYVRRDRGFDVNTTVHVLNVEKLLTQKDEKQLLTAIEIGLELLSGKSSQVQLKLHSESRLLFAKGTQQETKLIDNIVSEMQKSVWVPTRNESSSK